MIYEKKINYVTLQFKIKILFQIKVAFLNYKFYNITFQLCYI